MSDKNRNRNIVICISTTAVLGVAGFLTWKFALDEPQNLTETREGIGEIRDKAGDQLEEWDLGNFTHVFDGFDDLSTAAGDKWDEWDFGNFTDVLDGLDDSNFGELFSGGPKLGDNTTLVWKKDFIQPNNGGLHLTLQNALDDTWQSAFDLAVADWQESDALKLSTERVEVDHTCKKVDGVMVVCNANFGATGWVGINENSIMGNVIVSSVAKMNEYYLLNANDAHRQFTMCHEIGHGLGLPHTDENPYNANLGNCLDYTDDPEENLDPGEVNMVKLRGMYLSQSRQRVRRRVEEDGRIVETTYILAR